MKKENEKINDLMYCAASSTAALRNILECLNECSDAWVVRGLLDAAVSQAEMVGRCVGKLNEQVSKEIVI